MCQWYYEPQGMADIRRLVTSNRHGLSDQDVDGFKAVLSVLQKHHDFKLTGPELFASSDE